VVVYRLALEGRIELVTSPPPLAEFGRVLIEKFARDAQAVQEAVVQVSSVGLVVRPSERLKVITHDPDDSELSTGAH
jgi:predicted nucleic acid-binding protein